MDAKIIRFPIERRMSRDISELSIGGIKRFCYTESDNVSSWFERFIIGKSVLIGWTAVNDGIVESFKRGQVRHTIARVGVFDVNRRPSVEVCCEWCLHEIYNWDSKDTTRPPYASKIPVVLLDHRQSKFFRECSKCNKSEGIANVTNPDY